MSEAPIWPICLRLHVGATRLMLPAALFEQTLACNPLRVPAASGGGWQMVPGDTTSAFTRLGFHEASAQPWSATWLAVLNRLPEELARQRRFALLLNEAPRVLPPLASSLTVSRHSPGPHTVARVQVDGEELLVPDLNCLSALGSGDASNEEDVP